MRRDCKEALHETLRQAFLNARRERGYTQQQMAELLMMDQRSYGLLENGKTFCSALTLILFLTHFCPDTEAFIERLRDDLRRIHHPPK